MVELNIIETHGADVKIIISLITNVSKPQSSHYRNISTDPRGTGHGSPGVRGSHFGKHYRRRCKDLEQCHWR